MSATADILYSIEDVNNTIRQTNSLLRGLNAVRVMAKDLQEAIRKPTLANVFWTLVNLSRVLNSLKRINRLVQEESNVSLGFIKGLGRIPMVDIEDTDIPALFGSMDMQVMVNAFRENIPMGLEGLDLSNIPDRASERIQQVIEDDADMTVQDARQILRSRIIHPDRSTGNLEHSIYWQNQSNGVRIIADMPYAWWVERGQRTFTGHWYLHDAVAMSRERLPMKIKAELDNLIKGENKS